MLTLFSARQIDDNGKKFVFRRCDSTPPGAIVMDRVPKEIFQNKKLRYSYFKKITDVQERALFRKIQKGKRLTPAGALFSIPTLSLYSFPVLIHLAFLQRSVMLFTASGHATSRVFTKSTTKERRSSPYVLSSLKPSRLSEQSDKD